MTVLVISDAATCFKVLSNRNCHQPIRSTFLSTLTLNYISTVNTVWNTAML